MLLRLEKVSKFFGNRLILKSISLDLVAGEILLLAGANGAGKTTLLRIMAALSSPSSGRVTQTLGENGLIGYMGHQTFIYPRLSASENLGFWQRYHGLSGGRTALEAVLDRVELAPFADELAGTFSRGMAQRLNLARILLLSPKLLLLDEPSTGLDFRSRALLASEIAQAAKNGAGIAWISHSLAEDLPLAHRIAVLENAALVRLGPAQSYQDGSNLSTAAETPEAAC